MSDDELINRIRQGDEAAAEELIRRWYPSILRYCRWRCGSEAGADLTQETFLRLFRSLACYREGGSFKGYLFSIANRLCIDESQKPPLYPLEEDSEHLADGRDLFGQLEDRDEIRALLTALPPEQREAVLLRFGQRLSYRDIAQATGCDLRTAQSRVKYALNAMRKRKGHE